MEYYLKAAFIVILVVGVVYFIKRCILAPVKVKITLEHPTDIHLTTLQEHPPEDVDKSQWVQDEQKRLKEARAARMFDKEEG